MIYIEQPPFLPWLGFCEALLGCDVVALYDDVQFSERNVQNRNKIKTSQGTQWITAPVRAEQKVIKEIRLADTYDPSVVRRQLAAALGRARHYDEMESVVMPAMEGHQWLMDLNRSLIVSIASGLGSSVRLVETSTIRTTAQDRLSRLAEICNGLGSPNLWAGSGTRSYTSESQFNDYGIVPVWSAFETRHPEYRQLWMRQGFVPSLSAVDAIANLGWAGTRAMLEASLRAFRENQRAI